MSYEEYATLCRAIDTMYASDGVRVRVCYNIHCDDPIVARKVASIIHYRTDEPVEFDDAGRWYVVGPFTVYAPGSGAA